MDFRREVAVALAEAAEMVAAAVREEAPGSQVAGVDGDVAVVTVPDDGPHDGLGQRIAGGPGVAPQPALLTALAEVAPLAARHVADVVAAALRDTLRRGGR